MVRIVLDAELVKRLGNLNVPIELIDADGAVRATVSLNGRCELSPPPPWEPPLAPHERLPPNQWVTVSSEEVLAKLRVN